jgi:hypothetical protein
MSNGLTDGTTSWVPLNILKEQIPMEIAEYAVMNSISTEPRFCVVGTMDTKETRRDPSGSEQEILEELQIWH